MNYTKNFNRGVSWFGLALSLGATALTHASPLDDVRKLVEIGQFEAAYKTSQVNPQEIGTPHFDFLYGLAAIGAGHVPEGVLALERHLSAIPANDRARLEMARGYFLLGEYGRARTEFEFVLKHNPPKAVQENIQRYLVSMQTRDSTALRATSRFYIDAGLGHDSNVNGGTYNSTIDLMTGSIPIVTPSTQAIADSYSQLTAGGQWVKRVSSQLAVFAGGDFDFKMNQNETTYNVNNYGLMTGFSYLKDAGMYRVTVADGVMEVNGTQYRDMFSITGEAQYTVAPGRLLSSFVQYGAVSHTGANKVRDANLITLGGSINQTFEGVRFQPSLGARLSIAKERNLRMRNDLSRVVQTVRIFAGASPVDRVGVSVGLTWQQQVFGQADMAFGTVRNDTMYGADLGLNYAIDLNWSARLELQVSDNKSNQNLYDFTRSAWIVKVRREF